MVGGAINLRMFVGSLVHKEQILLIEITIQRRTNIFQGVGAEVTIWQSHSPKSP